MRGQPAPGTTIADKAGMIHSKKHAFGARGDRAAWRRTAVTTAVAALALCGDPARASFLSGDTLDTAADVLAWVVLVLVPVVGIVLFWMVHVLPEKIAHKRHHPQKAAIQTLCLLSLVFGGLLWPFAWLWAYTKPVGYRMAYGTDKGDEYFVEMGERLEKGELAGHELQSFGEELDEIAARGALTPELLHVRSKVQALVRARSGREGASPPAGGA